MKRYIIRELYPSGSRVLVSHMCELGEFELLFDDMAMANELLFKLIKARPESKFNIIELNIEG